MSDLADRAQSPFERQLREMNDRLLVSSALQHELAERAREAEEALRRLNETLEQRVEERTGAVRELAAQLTMAEHAERHRIAQILHDDLQQSLYSIGMKLALLRDDCESAAREELRQAAAESAQWVAEAVETTRHLSVDLSPQVLEDEGLTGAVRWLALQMKELHGLEVEIHAENGSIVLPMPVRVVLFQIVRELLFNVVKHAAAKEAWVTLRQADGEVTVQVRDRGIGFDVESLEERSGFGVSSVRHRLTLLGGRMEIESQPSRGTAVSIHAPVELG